MVVGKTRIKYLSQSKIKIKRLGKIGSVTLSFLSNMIINVYSIILLFIIYLQSMKNTEKESSQYKIYMKILLTTMLMLVIDILSRFDGKTCTIYPLINHIGNFLIFLLSPMLPSLWLRYVYYQVYKNVKHIKELTYTVFLLNVVNAVMLVLTQFNGWFYYIDSDNIYHRGPLFLVSASITGALLLVAYALIVVNREKIVEKYYFSLAFFAVPPFVCIILQILFYGVPLILNSVVLSLFIVFINIQNRSMDTDFLTGVNNRKKLEIYLKGKVSTSTKNKTFSAIMIDLDNFKAINDIYGHDMGDTALQTSAKLLSSCIRATDFIARYGGDEFFIVLDTSNSDELEDIVSRIDDCIKKYNESSVQPYELSFSMGYAIYNYNSHMKVEEFQKQIDALMYEKKQARKNEKTSALFEEVNTYF